MRKLDVICNRNTGRLCLRWLGEVKKTANAKSFELKDSKEKYIDKQQRTFSERRERLFEGIPSD